MIITIISPDKVTLSMFYDFYQTLYDPGIKLIDLNCLYSSDVINNALTSLEDQSKTGNNFFVRFKTKVGIKETPSVILDLSDIIIKFDIFSLKAEVVKSNGEKTSAIIDRWDLNIKRLNN